MKSILTIIFLSFIANSITSFAQIKVDASGNVGINQSTPSYKLDVNGSFRFSLSGTSIIYDNSGVYPLSGSPYLGTYSYRWSNIWGNYAYFTYAPVIVSDLNMKTNIRELKNINDKFILLHPVLYKLDNVKLKIDSTQSKVDDQYGLIAQEVNKIFPEIVIENEDGTMGIRYTELIPILIKVVQNQQSEIDSLKEQVAQLAKAKTN